MHVRTTLGVLCTAIGRANPPPPPPLMSMQVYIYMMEVCRCTTEDVAMNGKLFHGGHTHHSGGHTHYSGGHTPQWRAHTTVEGTHHSGGTHVIHVIQDHHRLSNHLLNLGLQLGIAGKMGPLTVHAIKGWVSRDVRPIW